MIRRCLMLAAVAASVVTFALAWPMSSSAAPAAQQTAKASAPANDPSGMYSFLREGEFVQLTLEDGKVSGFISRFGDADSDKGEFIDQFFDTVTLTGERLSFKTKMVHGVWYEFTGTITIGRESRREQE